MRGGRYVIGLLLFPLLITGCKRQGPQDVSLEKGNAVYFWRTELRLDSTERAFLKQFHINKVYCRYFDVVMSDDGAEPKPNATIVFSDTLPDSIEIVPTIYITEDCMHKPHPDLAEKMVKRIIQMSETNHIKGIHEIQIDCDYTSKSRSTYYKFLEEVRHHLTSAANTPSPITCHLSTTIRLHQLSMPVPPVDRKSVV